MITYDNDEDGQWPLINRSAVTLIHTETFLDWVNSVPNAGKAMTLESVNAECTVYLIPEQAINAESWIKENYHSLFQEELCGWYTDEEYWPKDLSYQNFQKYFNVLFSSMVFDAGVS